MKQHLGKRPKKITTHTDRKVIRFVKKNPFASARDTTRKLELDILENTVRGRLDDAGLGALYRVEGLIRI